MMYGNWSCLDNCLKVITYFWELLISHKTRIKNLYHIRIELYHVESFRVMREDIFCKRTIARSHFYNMLLGNYERACDICKGFFIDEEILSERFFSFDGFHDLILFNWRKFPNRPQFVFAFFLLQSHYFYFSSIFCFFSRNSFDIECLFSIIRSLLKNPSLLSGAKKPKNIVMLYGNLSTGKPPHNLSF